MLNEKVQDAFNEQVKNEFFSAYLYLSMSSYAESINLPGFAHWLRMQYEEELIHALRLYDFVISRGGRAILHAIEQPPVEFSSPLNIFQQVLEHEQKVTAMINNLMSVAMQNNDFASQIELQWFVTEQIEEEKNADGILQQLKMIGSDNVALMMLDKELATRLPPTPVTGPDAGAAA